MFRGNCILLQGALRKTIAAFVYVFPEMRDSIWAFLEQYDLPVVVGSPVGKSDQSSQVSAWLQGDVLITGGGHTWEP